VKVPPRDLDTSLLRQVLDREWRIQGAELVYVPLGFGDHHWRATSRRQRFFVTVRDLRLDGQATDRRAAVQRLETTFQAVRQLKACARLEFVVPAVPSASGATVVRIASNFAVSVFEWLEIEPSPDPSPAIAASLIARLHRSWRAHPVPALREDFRIPHRASLESSLAELNQPWLGGPYTESARAELLACHEVVQSTLMEYDALARAAEKSRVAWCLTHGEPNGGNLVRDRAGNWLFVDWESARIAPPERDLWELGDSALARYLELAGGRPPRTDLLHLYELWYALAETSVYLLQFRTPHTDDDNMAESWQNYLSYLPGRRICRSGQSRQPAHQRVGAVFPRRHLDREV